MSYHGSPELKITKITGMITEIIVPENRVFAVRRVSFTMGKAFTANRIMARRLTLLRRKVTETLCNPFLTYQVIQTCQTMSISTRIRASLISSLDNKVSLLCRQRLLRHFLSKSVLLNYRRKVSFHDSLKMITEGDKEIILLGYRHNISFHKQMLNGSKLQMRTTTIQMRKRIKRNSFGLQVMIFKPRPPFLTFSNNIVILTVF